MKISFILIFLTIISFITNVLCHQLFLKILSIVWYVASILIIYLAIYASKKYQFIQLNLKKILKSLTSKSNNNISPLASLSTSLAAKIGVGSLSGIAIAIYFGGIGTFFWIIVIGLLVSINTYIECILGIKYREKKGIFFVGGPSFYIQKKLNNKKLAIIYSILLIITYSIFFLSIQANTIISVTKYFNIDNHIIIPLLVIVTILIIKNGLKSISKTNSILVPVMLLFYLVLGIIILINNINYIPSILIDVINSAFNIKSIIPIFLIGMQRAIFITESSLGTSAISASSCDNDPHKQGLIEIFGIYLTLFLVCLTTFLIIITSNYQTLSLTNINGIEIIIYAFRYHFGTFGSIFFGIIAIMFAFSTIISSYFFTDSNIYILTNNKKIHFLLKLLFIIILIAACYLKASFLWNFSDYFIAILAIINTLSIIKILYKT